MGLSYKFCPDENRFVSRISTLHLLYRSWRKEGKNRRYASDISVTVFSCLPTVYVHRKTYAFSYWTKYRFLIHSTFYQFLIRIKNEFN